MALTLSEQQLARSEDRILTDKRIDRISGLRQPTVQGELLHYSDKYGRTLTDEQVASLDENQLKFNEDINKAKGEIGEARTKVESLYGENKAKLSVMFNGLSTPADYQSYYDTAPKTKTEQQYTFGNNSEGGDFYQYVEVPRTNEEIEQEYWNNWNYYTTNQEYRNWAQKYKEENLVPVRMLNNGQQVGTYYLDPNAAAQVYNQTVESARQGWNWIASGDPSQEMAIDVRGYGAEFYQIMIPYQQSLDAALAKAYNTQMPEEVNKGLTQLETEYGQANATLAQRQSEVQGYEQQNAEALTTLRMKYQEKLSNIKDTIGSLIHG